MGLTVGIPIQQTHLKEDREHVIDSTLMTFIRSSCNFSLTLLNSAKVSEKLGLLKSDQ